MNQDLTQCQEADGQLPQPADRTPPQSQMNPKNLSRRKFFTDAPKVVTGAAVGAGILGMASKSEISGQAQEPPTFPWPYKTLDPKAVGERAYKAYNSGKGCMYGVAEGLIGELREQVGYPYTIFPVGMMEYGKGGVNGVWGTLCGTLNGAAAVINLVNGAPAPLINEMFFWASQEQLPNFRPQSPKFEISPSVSGSPICHVSVQRWCEASGFKPTSPERAERCAWLTAAVASHTAELLNKQAAGSFSAAHTLPAEVQSCMACHGKGAQENVHHGGNLSCAPCHSEVDEVHPKKHLTIRWTGTGTLEKADAVTGPWSPAASQSSPQPLPLNEPAKFFRLK